MSLRFYLMTETAFHASYLVTDWLDTFGTRPEFCGLIVRESLDAERRQLRERFHQDFHGMRHLSPTGQHLLRAAYPDLSQAEQAMITRFGVPRYATTHHAATLFLGENLNDRAAYTWLTETCATGEVPYFFIFLDQLLKPWWVEQAPEHIINAHSAVLPYARGMHAIENMAALHDTRQFNKAAGATVHFVNTGIDAGPIIAAHTFSQPLHFDSIWDLKGASYVKAFELLIGVAEDLTSHPTQNSISSPQDQEHLGPCFRRKDFTARVRSLAESGYMTMKEDEAAVNVAK